MALDMDKLQEFLGRFVADLGATFAAGNVVIGHRLGLYRALATGPAAAEELAGRTTSTTSPAKSNPAPRGNDRPVTSFSFPARTAMSAPLTLLAATRTSTCPGRSRGTGTVRIRRTSGGP
jgi:hypothetical protein